MIHSEPAAPNRNILVTVLVVALIVSILMLLVSFTGIAPDLPTKIGMGSIAFIVGFFGVQGWISKTGMGLALCIIFGTAEVFTHTSFFLISTNLQTEVAKSVASGNDKDPELERLMAREKTLTDAAIALSGAVASLGEGFRSEVDIRQQGIKDANKAAEDASKAVSDYVALKRQALITGQVHAEGIVIDADRFFTAIPDALTSGQSARWIAFFFAVLIFAGVQITVLIAADGMIALMEKKRQEKELAAEAEKTAELLAEELKKPKTGRAPGVVRAIPKKVVYGWVDALWHAVREGTSDKIISRPQALKFLVERKIPITKLHDEKLFNLAVKLGIIDADGTVRKTAIEARTVLDEAQKRKE
jgi:hypothetical protein